MALLLPPPRPLAAGTNTLGLDQTLPEAISLSAHGPPPRPTLSLDLPPPSARKHNSLGTPGL